MPHAAVRPSPSHRFLGAAIRALLTAAIALGATVPSPAAEPPLYPWDAPRLPGIPSPESVLGYRIGERMTSYADTMRYLEALDAGSDRVTLFSYARSHEGRLLRYAVISSPGNLARLQVLRRGMQRLANPEDLGTSEAGDLIRTVPVFVWLGYSVHGDEHSTTEAALAVAYHLASADDDRTKRILDAAVIFIDPIQNPDGRERFIQSYYEAAGTLPNRDPMAAEHDEPWPSGRFNHDLFDLNRDWLWLAQPETRGKIAAFLAWRPLLYVDHHEMGTDSTYYFAPPARPININVAESVQKWFKVIGEGNAKAFDALGFDYFTEEFFDLFYPGYGDSWPTLNGAVGMTYEEATAAGLEIERKDGTILTLRDAARRHIAASLATAETAAGHREEMLRDYYDDRKAALQDGGAAVKGFLIPPDPDPGGAGRLARLLAAQGVRLIRSKEEFSARVSAGGEGPAETKRFPAGTFIAPLLQPSRRLLTALLERDPKLDEPTLKEAAERRRLRTDAPFYDVTSWSVPLAMNVPVFAAHESPKVQSTPLAREEIADLPGHPQPPAGFEPWPPLPPPSAAGGEGPRPATPRASYAYLLPPSGNDALAAFTSLLARGDLSTQVAGKKFTLTGRAYAAGTAIFKVHRNPETLHAAVAEAAARFNASFDAAGTGLTEEGIDLGSNAVRTVKMPRIAAVYGEPTSPTSIGWLTYILRERFGVPFVPVRTRTLANQADLRRYDVIIMPDGSSMGYKTVFGGEGGRRIRAWIEEGGTLITIRGASAFAADKDLGWISSRVVRRPRSAPFVPAAASEKDKSKDADPNAAAQAGQELSTGETASSHAAGPEEESPDYVPGAILRVLLEPGHPVAFGFGSEVPVLVNSNLVLSLSKDGVNAGVFAPRDRLRIGGFAWKESLDLLAGKGFLIVEQVGRGKVVLFAEDPDFRGGWEGLSRLLLNAILLVPTFAD